MEIDECLSNPCLHNAVCQDLANDFKCNCISGTRGKRCEENIDDCVNVTCKNQGICQDFIDGFACLCPEGFTGIW